MLFNGFAGPLHLRRKSSRLLLIYLLSLHTLALIALLQALAIPAGVHALLYVVWGGSVVFHVIHFLHQRDDEKHYWIWQSGDNWLQSNEERIYSLNAKLSLQTPWFVMLTLTAAGQTHQRLLFIRDQLDADSYRRLRVRLKLYHEDAADSRDEAV